MSELEPQNQEGQDFHAGNNEYSKLVEDPTKAEYMAHAEDFSQTTAAEFDRKSDEHQTKYEERIGHGDEHGLITAMHGDEASRFKKLADQYRQEAEKRSDKVADLYDELNSVVDNNIKRQEADRNSNS